MKREQRELLDAARAYGEATESGSSEPLAGAQAAAALRLCAKRFFHADRADRETERKLKTERTHVG